MAHSASLHTQTGSVKTVADLQSWALKGDRYSPNLAKWCAKNSCGPANQVFRHKDGGLYIGWLDEGRHLIGSRLWQVLTSGARSEAYCWTGLGGDLTPIADFWADYARIGRCAIDTDHSRGFVGSETRWTEEGDTRSCIWCSNHRQFRRRWTETVERQCWETRTTAAASQVGTSNASEPIIPTNGDSHV